MARFKVLQPFAIGADMPVKMLVPGAIYLQDDEITVTLAEGAELLRLSPAGTFVALDGEGRSAEEWLARKAADHTLDVGGTVDGSGDLARNKRGS